MKKTLLSLFALVLAFTASAQSLPTDGRVLYFDFNGNVVEKNSGNRLKQFQDKKLQNISDAQFVDLEDGNKAFVANGQFIINKRVDQARYKDITVVMRLKATLKDNGTFFSLCTNPNEKDFSTFALRNIDFNEDGNVKIFGCPSYNSNDYISNKSEKSVADDFRTIIATFTTDSIPQILAVDNSAYSFYEAHPTKSKIAYDNILIGYDSICAQIDYMAVYNRILLPEEMEAIVGTPIEPKELEQDMWEGAYDFPKIAALWLIFVVIWFVILLKRKMYPKIDEAYMKSRGKGINTDAANKEEATRLVEKAKSYWGDWEESEAGTVTCKYPKKWMGYRQSQKAFESALDTGYYDDEIKRDYNNLARAFNKGKEYCFHGISWMPLVCLIAYFTYHIGFKWIDGHGSLWSILSHGLFSMLAFSYYVLILSYVVVCYCPKHIGRRGKPVDMFTSAKSGIKWPNKEDFREGGSKAGGFIGYIFALVGVGIIVGLKALGWVLSNSVSYFNVIRNGVKVGTTTAFNPAGLVMLGVAIVAIGTLMLMASMLFSIITIFITPIRFIINYVLRL